jgi:hypothetical protein
LSTPASAQLPIAQPISVFAALGDQGDKQRDRERLQALTTACSEGEHDHVCGYKLGYFLQVDTKNATLAVEEFRAGVLVSGFSLDFAQKACAPGATMR